MFRLGDIIGDVLKNYPGGSAEFDEAEMARPEPDMDADDALGGAMAPSPAAPRQINRSPFADWMDREKNLR